MNVNILMEKKSEKEQNIMRMVKLKEIMKNKQKPKMGVTLPILMLLIKEEILINIIIIKLEGVMKELSGEIIYIQMILIYPKQQFQRGFVKQEKKKQLK